MTKKNILGIFYYIGVVIILPLYNWIIDLLKSQSVRSYDFTMEVLLIPLAGLFVGAYLLLNQWVQPLPLIKIGCKALLVLFLFFGWSLMYTAYLPVIRLVDHLSFLPSVICGYFLLSLISDIISLYREKKKAIN